MRVSLSQSEEAFISGLSEIDWTEMPWKHTGQSNVDLLLFIGGKIIQLRFPQDF